MLRLELTEGQIDYIVSAYRLDAEDVFNGSIGECSYLSITADLSGVFTFTIKTLIGEGERAGFVELAVWEDSSTRVLAKMQDVDTFNTYLMELYDYWAQ